LSHSEFLTTEEYAGLSRSPRTIERERETGDGCPYVRLGSRIFYRRADIDRWIEQHVHGGDVVREPTKAPAIASEPVCSTSIVPASSATAPHSDTQTRRRGRPRKNANSEAAS
jgi:hypothetical protein